MLVSGSGSDGDTPPDDRRGAFRQPAVRFIDGWLRKPQAAQNTDALQLLPLHETLRSNIWFSSQ